MKHRIVKNNWTIIFKSKSSSGVQGRLVWALKTVFLNLNISSSERKFEIDASAFQSVSSFQEFSKF